MIFRKKKKAEEKDVYESRNYTCPRKRNLRFEREPNRRGRGDCHRGGERKMPYGERISAVRGEYRKIRGN